MAQTEKATAELQVILKFIEEGATAGAEAMGKAVKDTGKATEDTGRQAKESSKAFQQLHDTLDKGAHAAGGYVKNLGGIRSGLAGLKNGLGTITAGMGALAVSQASADSKMKSFMLSMGKIGAEGPKVLESLRAGSLGMMSDVQLMEKTTQATMLIGVETLGKGEEFAGNFKKMLQISMAAARATGEDTNFMFDSMVRGIGRASPMILDNLGLTLRMGEVYKNAAAELGKSEKELTMVERKTALMNAVFKQGLPFIEKYGISSGGLKTQIQKLQSSIANISLHLARTFMPTMSELMSALNHLVSLAEAAVVPVFQTIEKAAKNISPPILAMTTALLGLAPVLSIASKAGGSFITDLIPGGKYIGLLAGAIGTVLPLLIGLSSTFKTTKGKWTDFAKSIADESHAISKNTLVAFEKFDEEKKKMAEQGIESDIEFDVGLGIDEWLVTVSTRMAEVREDFFSFAGGIASAFGLIVDTIGSGFGVDLPDSLGDWIDAFDATLNKVHAFMDVLGNFGGLMSTTEAGVKDAADGFGLMTEAFGAPFEAAEGGVQRLMDAFANLAGLFPEYAGQIETVGQYVGVVVQAFSSWFEAQSHLWDAAKFLLDGDLGNALVNVQEYAIDLGAAWMTLADGLLSDFLPSWDEVMTGAGDLAGGLVDTIVGVGESMWGAWDELLQNLFGFEASWETLLGDMLNVISVFSEDAVSRIVDFGKAVLDYLVAAVPGWWEAFKVAFPLAVGVLANGLGQIAGFIVGWIPSVVPKILNAVKTWGSALGGFAEDEATWGRASHGLYMFVQNAVGWILTEGVPMLFNAALMLIGGFATGFIDNLKRFWDSRGPSAAQQTADAMSSMGEAGLAAAEVAGAELALTWDQIILQSEQDLAALQGVADQAAQITSGLKNNAGLAGLFGAMDQGIAQGGGKDMKIDLGGGAAAGVGGGGGGGKAAKGGGGGKGAAAKKDPLQAAYQAISSVSSAISAGIDAINKMWTEWRGAPPEDLWAEVFEVFEFTITEMLTLVGQIDPIKADQAAKGASMVGGFLSAISSALDVGNALARARIPSEGMMQKAFDLVGQTTEWAMELASETIPGNLDEAVKITKLGADLAKMIGEWLGAITGAAGLSDLQGRRLDVDWTQITGVMEGALDVGIRLKDRMVGDGFQPRDMIDTRETIEVTTSMIGALGEVASAASALRATRWPDAGAMPAAEAFMRQAFTMGVGLVEQARSAGGEGYLILLEDAQQIAGLLPDLIGSVESVANAARALRGVRFDGDIESAFEMMEDIFRHASELTDSTRDGRAAADDFRDHLDDLGMLGGTMSPWVSLISDLGGTFEALDELGIRRMFGHAPDLGPIYDYLQEVNNVMSGLLSANGALGVGTTEDLHVMASVLGAWVGVLGQVGAAVGAQRTIQIHLSTGGTMDLGPIRDYLVGLMVMSGEFLSAGQEAFGSDLENSLGESGFIAEALGAWVDLMSNLDEAMEATRLAGGKNVTGADLQRVFSTLEFLANEAWATFGGSIGMPGSDIVNEASRDMADTIGAWVGLVASVDMLAMSLKRGTAIGGIDPDDIREFFDMLLVIGGESWRLLNGDPDDPHGAIFAAEFGALQSSSQQAAATMVAWIGAIAQMAEATRKLASTRGVNPGVWTVLEATLTKAWDAVKKFARDTANDRDTEGDMKRATQVMDAIGTFVDLVSSLSDMTRDVVSTILPVEEEWERIGVVLRRLMTMGSRLVNDPEIGVHELAELAEEQADRWAAFASKIGAIGSAISTAAGTNLQFFTPPTDAEWDLIEDATRTLIERGTRILSMPDKHPYFDDTDPGQLTDEENKAGVYGAIASQIGAIGKALGAVFGTQFNAADIGTFDEEAASELEAIARRMLGFIDNLYSEWSSGRRDPQRDAKFLADFGKTIKGIADSIGAVVKLAGSMAGFEVPATATGQIGKLRGFISEMYTLISDLAHQTGPMSSLDTPSLTDADLERARREAERAWQFVGQYAGVVSQGAGALSSVIGAMNTIHEKHLSISGFNPTLKRQLRAFIHDSIAFWQELTDEYETGTVEADRAWAEVTKFTSAVSSVVSPIKTLVDTMQSLLDIKWEFLPHHSGGGSTRVLRDLVLGADFMEDIRRNINVMIRAMIFVLADTKASLVYLDNADFEAQFEQVAKTADRVGRLASAINAIPDAIASWFGESGSGGIPTFVSKHGSNWMTRVRTRRADFFAQQLADGIRRTVGAIIGALNSIYIDTDIDVNAKRLFTAVDSVASAIDRAMGIFRYDTEGEGKGTLKDQALMLKQAVDILEEAFTGLEANEGLDLWAKNIERAVNAIANALARIAELDFDLGDIVRFRRAIEELYGATGGEGGGRRTQSMPGEPVDMEIVRAEIGDGGIGIGGKTFVPIEAIPNPNRRSWGKTADGDGSVIQDNMHMYGGGWGFIQDNMHMYGGGGNFTQDNMHMYGGLATAIESLVESLDSTEVPPIIIEPPIVEVTIKNQVDAKLVMSTEEIARAATFFEEHRHITDPSNPPTVT